MWTAFTRIFTGQHSNDQLHGGGDGDRGTSVKDRPPQNDEAPSEDRSAPETVAPMDMDDSYDTKQAKQRASVKWLLSKAFNNKVPPNLKEPFYRDHENQEHLKPQILGALSNAELYCLALGNIYSDPNYHNLNHWAILQTLARKGVYVTEPADATLTETTLIQTNPLRMTAHMAVIEAIMALYAREVVSGDRVLAAMQRFAWNAPAPAAPLPPAPTAHEDGLLLWVNQAIKALLGRIRLELEGDASGRVNGGDKESARIPDIPPVTEMRDLCDGVALAALICYYCPEELRWPDIRTGARLPSVAGSLHNLGLVQSFCTRCMSASVFHMLPEDVTYMRGAMKQNLVVFLADLFNLLEIHPLQCVRYPGMDKISSEGFPVRNAHGVVHKRNLPPNVMSPIPDLRSSLEEPCSSFSVSRNTTPAQLPLRKAQSHHQSTSEMSDDSLYRPVPPQQQPSTANTTTATSDDNTFIVHRGRNIPTLSNMQQLQQQLQHEEIICAVPVVRGGVRPSSTSVGSASGNGGSVEQLQQAVGRVAGKPSNWEDNKKSSFAGRRSRRNSTSDDSQLTIENFGGSQDNLNFIGRNPNNDIGAHVGRRISAPTLPTQPPPPAPVVQLCPVRSSLQDARGSLQLGYDDDDNDNNAPTAHVTSSQAAHSNNNSVSGRSYQQTSPAQPAQTQNGGVAMGKNVMRDLVDGDMMGTDRRMGGVQLVYMQHNNTDEPADLHNPPSPPPKSSFLSRSNSSSNGAASGEKKTTTFATLPSTTTTWQQLQQQGGSGGGGDGIEPQYMQQHHGGVMSRSDEGGCTSTGGVGSSCVGVGGGAAQLNDIRLKLEEKRRDIENTKRRYEMDANRQRQKVGKAAFLQAVSNKGKVSKSPPLSDCMVDSLMTGAATAASAPSSPTGGAEAPPERPHTAPQDIPDPMERKWMDQNGSYSDRRVAEMDNMDLEKYQHSISQMNSSLVDMQADIQRLANQHNQMQLAQFAQKQQQMNQHQLNQQQQMYQQQQQQQNYQVNPAHMHQYSSPYSNTSYNSQSGGHIYNPLQSSASAPHIPHSLYQQQQQQQRLPPSGPGGDSPQFFLHSSSGGGGGAHHAPAVAPVVPQRRTWAQHQPPTAQPTQAADGYHQPEMRTWGSKPHLAGSPSTGGGGGGFMLHDTSDRDRYSDNRYTSTSDTPTPTSRYTNGNTPTPPTTGFSLTKQHQLFSSATATPTSSPASVNNSVQSTPGASPQHQRQHRQLSQLMAAGGTGSSPVSLQQMGGGVGGGVGGVGVMPPQRPERRSSGVLHAAIPAPSADDMEPQDISFIAGVGGQEHDGLSDGLSRLNITSGTRTYRIPSPTRPLLGRGSSSSSHYQSPPPPLAHSNSMDSEPGGASEPDCSDSGANKGFYISFDDEQPPKRPKPPLRMKKMTTVVVGGAAVGGVGGGGSPKKENREQQEDEKEAYEREREYQDKMDRRRQLERELDEERAKRDMHDEQRQRDLMGHVGPRHRDATSQERERDRVNAASTIIIGHDLNNPNPEMLGELERKKEKILLLSLQRRQQQEEAKDRKEAETCARREREKAKEEERARKKDEQIQRRAVILEQYKLKKAIEEAERDGKDIDKGMLSSLKPTPKMRAKPSTGRPRPKTIHIDSGSVEMAEGMLQPSRGKKGSTSNLTAPNAYNPSSMKRDYYRGSQDSLASTGLLYKDSPDDSRGMSPSSTSATGHQTLGRRSSYKTSRDPSPAQTRGRSSYSTYQNIKGRKSNSLMNLYGSSTDQDSMAYRYGDTDSGLGRATPPRRAASPGMGPTTAAHGGLRLLPSPSGPGSLPGGLITKQRRLFDDGSSDISSNASSMMDYNGPRLYKQPATKSNRGIMLNAVEYCVFPGVVNKEAKSRVLEEIARSESKHFLILFRDAGCQFRALYSYCPDGEEIIKLYGTGPKLVNDRMFDKFFKYNSGGKCFSQVHTKHLTVTIDAFTIHNSLWQGKKVNLPNKKDMTLVI